MLPTFASNSAEAFASDPPYGITMMASKWDNPLHLLPRKKGGRGSPNQVYQAWCECWMAEAYRILIPGKYICCFGAARMVHRVVAAVRACGFVSPQVCGWCYQTGVPMSVNIEKMLRKRIGEAAARFAGYGTSLKPAWEAVVIARKPE